MTQKHTSRLAKQRMEENMLNRLLDRPNSNWLIKAGEYLANFLKSVNMRSILQSFNALPYLVSSHSYLVWWIILVVSS